jgi:hypothetical protein
MKCPHCNKYKCEPEVVYMNVEAYGGRYVKFKCKHCKRTVGVAAERRVVFGRPRKEEGEGDWG